MSYQARTLTLACFLVFGSIQPLQAQSFGPAVASWFVATQQAISGFSVSVKQTAISSEQISSATKASFKGAANTIVQFESNQRIVAEKFVLRGGYKWISTL
jgi:hypothetical protein